MSSTQDSLLLEDIETIRTNLNLLSKSTRQFISSVIDYHQRKGYVTQGQRPHIYRIAQECKELRARTENSNSDSYEEVFDGTPLRTLFSRGSSHLKFPRIRYQVAGIPGNALHFHVAGPNSRTPGFIVCTNGKKYPEKRLYATVDLRGEGQITRNLPAELKKIIRRFAASPETSAKLSGLAFSNCCYCGLELTHPVSLFHGHGPICAEKWGLPWEGDPEATKQARNKEVELYPIDGLDKIGLEDL